jgi:hypothetical protein
VPKKRKHQVSSDEEEVTTEVSVNAEISEAEEPAMSVTDPFTEPTNSEVEDGLSAYERYETLYLCLCGLYLCFLESNKRRVSLG